MYDISKALMEPPAIPPIRQGTPGKQPAIVVAAIAVSFGLNAMAAEIASPANTPSATSLRAKPGENLLNQQDTRKKMFDNWEKMSPKEREQVRDKMKDHWKNMSPEEREARRKEMREHFKNMSPEERRQFQRDMGKADNVSTPATGLRGKDTDRTAAPAR